MKMKRTKQSKAEAFTLLEVLLAVGIFAIVLFAMNTVFFTALRLERATNRAVDARLPLNQALAIMRRDLQGAVQPNTNSTLLPKHFVASASGGGFGSAQSGTLEFYTTTGLMNDNEPWSDLQRVQFELVDSTEPSANPNAKELVRRVSRNVLATTTEQEEEQLLASDVESLEFQCYDGSSWSSVWDTENGSTGLPHAVRVRVHLATNTGDATKLKQEPLELLVPLVVQSLTNSIAGGGQ